MGHSFPCRHTTQWSEEPGFRIVCSLNSGSFSLHDWSQPFHKKETQKKWIRLFPVSGSPKLEMAFASICMVMVSVAVTKSKQLTRLGLGVSWSYLDLLRFKKSPRPHETLHMWRSEDKLGWSSPFTLFETGSYTGLSGPGASWGLTSPHPISPHSPGTAENLPLNSALYRWFGKMNSDPDPYTTGSLAFEPSGQPWT